MAQEELVQEGERDGGEILASWETWERMPVQRGRRWYATAAIIGVALIVYGVLTTNFLFALVIVMAGMLLVLRDLQPPRRVMAHVTNLGVAFGDEFVPFTDLKDFAIVYNPPAKYLYLSYSRRLSPVLAIPLEDADPLEIRTGILPYLQENLARDEERLTEALRRVYKL